MAGLLAVMLAACSSGTSPAPSAAPSVEPTSQPTPTTAATPAPTATTPGLSAKVTFDGETCSYVGPTVLPDGTILRIEYAPDQEFAASRLLIYGVEPGTTYQDLLDSLANDDGNVATDVPDWVYQQTATFLTGAGTLVYAIRSVQHGINGDYAVGGYQLMCNTPAGFPAVQFSVAGT